MKDLRQSPQYAKYLESIGWKTDKINGNYVYIKKILLLGNFIKIQRPRKILGYKDIKILEKSYHPFQFSIEPTSNENMSTGFKLSSSPSLPTKTIQIDSTKSENELLKSFSQKTRYNIHLAERKEVKIVESKNILDFTNFWRENFERKRFTAELAGMPIFSQQKNVIAMHNAFAENSRILLAKKNSETIAVLLLLFYDGIAYYMYAASNDEGRKYFAPTLLTWNAILLAKKLKCKVFDFDGIYDERFPIKTWLGFTKFKKGFGGKEVEYPGRFVSKAWPFGLKKIIISI